MHYFLLTLLLSLATPPSAPQGERMYVQNGFQLKTIDPATGELLHLTPLLPLINNKGLVFDEGRLYLINQNIFLWRDFLVEVEPATGRWSEIGKTGFSLQSSDVSLVRDPTTSRYFAQFNEGFFEIDKATGHMTFLSRVEPEQAIITAIAIDSKGRVFGYSTPTIYYPKSALYLIDLSSGRLAHFGDLPPVPISFTAMGFDQEGTLWAAGYGPFSFFEFRLYKVDIDTLELTVAFPLPDGAEGIAFGPAPDVDGFCRAKTNSAGCAPSIHWSGHPSATAYFGFEVTCSDVRNQSAGFLLIGLGGRAGVPFQGGTLCVAAPLLRTTPLNSGGSPAALGDCSGIWSIDVNTWLAKNHVLEPGASFACQWWGRDPGLSGPDSGQLSDALEVVLFP